MTDLNIRKEKILTSVIRSYVEDAVPVGSEMLTRKFRLAVSSATIRNEMGELEELGYLMHPHTSAGRIPTDKGYRYFVDRVAKPEPLSRVRFDLLHEAYQERIRSAEELLDRTLHILSTLSHHASLIFVPEEESFVLKSVNLIPMEGNMVLVLWVSAAGFTRSCMIDMAEPLSEEDLERLSHFLNKELAGLTYCEIKDFVIVRLKTSKDSLKDLYEKACQIIEGSLSRPLSEKIYCEGSSRMLEQPEFQKVEEARPVLTGLEEKRTIQGLLRETLQSEGLAVCIGSETRSILFRECSLVSVPYYQAGHRMGVLGVLGPKRMRYEEVMSLVTQAAQLMRESFERWFE